MQHRRASGILLHPTSLPGNHGVGDFGSEAFVFVDFLHNSGQQLWQILPLTHPGADDSPYNAYSSFAGNPLLISLEKLVETQLLTQEEISRPPFQDGEKIGFGLAHAWKEPKLKKTYQRFLERQENTQTD